jgi:hypothetical protein
MRRNTEELLVLQKLFMGWYRTLLPHGTPNVMPVTVPQFLLLWDNPFDKQNDYPSSRHPVIFFFNVDIGTYKFPVTSLKDSADHCTAWILSGATEVTYRALRLCPSSSTSHSCTRKGKQAVKWSVTTDMCCEWIQNWAVSDDLIIKTAFFYPGW